MIWENVFVPSPKELYQAFAKFALPYKFSRIIVSLWEEPPGKITLIPILTYKQFCILQARVSQFRHGTLGQ